MRNIRCPHYNECLDAAIDLELPGFECDGCRHVREVGRIDPGELEGAALFLIAVFYPEAYAGQFVRKQKSMKGLKMKPEETPQQSERDLWQSSDLNNEPDLYQKERDDEPSQ